MKTVSAGKVVEALLKIFTHVGLPIEILTDKGSNFRTQVFKKVCIILKIEHL